MSVGDIKGSRRRIKQLRAVGHFPKRAGLTVAESIVRNRAQAARMLKAARKAK